jgi:hypothetical protein
MRKRLCEREEGRMNRARDCSAVVRGFGERFVGVRGLFRRREWVALWKNGDAALAVIHDGVRNCLRRGFVGR